MLGPPYFPHASRTQLFNQRISADPLSSGMARHNSNGCGSLPIIPACASWLDGKMPLLCLPQLDHCRVLLLEHSDRFQEVAWQRPIKTDRSLSIN